LFQLFDRGDLAFSSPDEVVKHAGECPISGTKMASGYQFKLFELIAFFGEIPRGHRDFLEIFGLVVAPSCSPESRFTIPRRVKLYRTEVLGCEPQCRESLEADNSLKEHYRDITPGLVVGPEVLLPCSKDFAVYHTRQRKGLALRLLVWPLLTPLTRRTVGTLQDQNQLAWHRRTTMN
jgi:hypothetical protein